MHTGFRSSSLEGEVIVERCGASNTQQTMHVQGRQFLDNRHQLAGYRNVESRQLNCWGLQMILGRRCIGAAAVRSGPRKSRPMESHAFSNC